METLSDVNMICFYSRPASDLKKREMNGSGIFNGAAAVNGEGNGADRTAVRMHQVEVAPLLSPSSVASNFAFRHPFPLKSS